MAGPALKASFICIFVLSFSGNTEANTMLCALGSMFEAFGIFPECVFSSCTGNETTCVNPIQNINQNINELQASVSDIQNNLYRPRSCDDLYNEGDITSGVRTIYPFPCCNDKKISVYCDQTTDGGGWTVIQHREDLPVRENFYRKWVEYQLGFGNLTGEFWLGLDSIHALVSQRLMELRIDLEDFTGDKRVAKYEYFYIANADDKYRLDMGKYSGNAGDGFKDRHVGYPFTTNDKDNDDYPENCAEKFLGGWWYDKCHISNLNGYQHEGQHSSYADGINWHPFHGYYYSLKKVSMSIRPALR